MATQSEADARYLHDLSEHFELDFWSGLKRSGGSVEVMVAPTLDAAFTLALSEQGLQHVLKHSDVQRLIDAAPMKTSSGGRDEDHGMDWDDFHDLATIYAWFDYLEGNIVSI